MRDNPLKRNSCDRGANEEDPRPSRQARANLDLLTKSEPSRGLSDERSTLSTRVFGVDELAIFFGCGTEKIKRMARRRELPAFKFGKSWYVREQDLEVYINRAVESNLRSQKQRG